jgi:DNA gyrase subunit B
MGSADNQGVLQCVREIITNSIDEYTMGYGDRIRVTLDKDNTVTVQDFGRGVPFGLREDGTDALEAIYTMPHSGGKFNDKTYQNVAGMNGIGAKGVALSSDYFFVRSQRDGKIATLILVNGVKQDLTVIDQKTAWSGTFVQFTPSQEVYNLEPININFKDIKKMCEDWSYLCKGLTFELEDKATGEKVTYYSKNGLVDLMKAKGGKALNKTPLSICLKEGDITAEIAMEWTDSRSETSYVFTNGLENVEGGTSLTGVKTALTNFFKKKLKGEAPPEVLRKGLLYAISCQVPNPSFANQTKTKVNNIELRGLCQRATTQMLESFEQQHADEFQRVLDLLAKEQKAELAAERARKQVLEAQKEVEKSQKKKYIASDKLKDAEFLGQDATLLIVEGNSAMASVGVARDEKTYGIMCIRGKIINALSNDEEKIYQNEEIKLLLSALNIVPGHYDSRKLRYGRVGVCTDSDSDGYHIGLLLMAALQYLAPQFIEEGRLGWLRSPLYIVKNGKTENYYFTDEEMDAARGHISGVIQRNKGIGSLTPEQAYNSMFTAKNQRFDMFQTSPDARDLLYNLMGKDVEPRTDFIFKNVDFSMIRE